MKARKAVLLAIGLALATAVLGAQRPLPDQESFLKETREHLQTDRTLQSSYVYVETRREMKLDKAGRTTDESIKVFENYPGLPGHSRRSAPPRAPARPQRGRLLRPSA